MRTSFRMIALAAAAAASPGLAQVGVDVGGQVGVGVGANAGVDAAGTVDRVGRTVDRNVDRTDRTVNRALGADATLATSADVAAGATVRDHRGRRIGTVQRVSANSAIVVQGNRQMRVPLSALYRTGRGLVTSLSRADLNASATTRASAGVRR